MPLYEYECARHGRFELIRKFSDPPLTRCPTCGQPVEKILSSPAIQFKGSGWYVTDYARKGNGGDGKGKSESKGESKGDGATKAADSKDGASKSSPSKDGTSKDSSAPGSSTK